MKKGLVLLTVVATLLIGLVASADTPFPLNWQGIKSPSPVGQSWASQCAYNGKIYVFGGNSSTPASSNVTLTATQIYDPATDTWTTGAPMPTARYLSTAVEVGGKIYVMGGRWIDSSGSGGPVDVNEMYDPATNTWTTMAAMRGSFRGHSAVAVNGRIFVFGGNTGSAQKTVGIYDPASNTWSAGANMPNARAYGGAVWVPSKSRVYYIGGYNLGSTSASYYGNVLVYNPIADEWDSSPIALVDKVIQFAYAFDESTGKIWVFSGLAYDPDAGNAPSAIIQVIDTGSNTVSQYPSVTPTPINRSNSNATWLNGKIYLIGGSVADRLVDVFDPVAGTWYEPNAPLPAYDYSYANMAAVGSKLYLINGAWQNFNDEVLVYDPAANDWSVAAATNPAPRTGAVSGVWNGKIVLSGGYDGAADTGTTQLYDPATGNFSALASDPTVSEFAGGAVYNNTLYVFGGASGSTFLTSVRALDLAANTWSPKADLPVGLYMPNAVAIGNKIYIVGGRDKSSDNELMDTALIYDPAANSFTTGASMPAAVYQAAAVAYDGHVIVLSGDNLYRQSGTLYYRPAGFVQIYTPASNTWTFTEAVFPRVNHVAAVLGNKLYITGGNDNDYAADRLEIAALASGPSLGVTVTPASQSVVVGGNVTFTATLSAAQAADVTLALSSANGTVATVPATATILANQTTATFAATGVGVGGPVAITATLPGDLGGGSGSAQLTVTGTTLSLSPGTLPIQLGNIGVMNAVIGNAQPGAAVINLASSNTAVAAVPATVTVNAGATQGGFTITAIAEGTATITATLPAALGGTSAIATVTVTNVPVTTLKYLVPSVAHLPGAGGTKWRTDVAAVNRNNDAAAITATYYPESGTPVTRNANVQAGGTVEWQDVLVSDFGYAADANTKGTLILETTLPLDITSRTYNQKSATETFGQSYPALLEINAINPALPATLPQIKKNAGFRTNVGAANLGDAAAQVRFTLFGANGAQLGNPVTLNVPAMRWVQQNDIFAAAGVASADIAWAKVDVLTNGAKVWTYASVIDATTGDPTTVPNQRPTAALTRTIPSVAHLPGKSNTKWRTDVAFVNTGASSASITLSYFDTAGNPAVVRNLTLDSGATIEIADILVTTFGFGADANTKGTLKVESNVSLAITSRTYNQKSATETFGQFYPALSVERSLTASQIGTLPQLKKNAGFRTNVGVANVGDVEAQVQIRLYGPTGLQMGSVVTLIIPAGKWVQQDDIFAAAGSAGADIAYATVDLLDAGGKIWAYASVVDNTTGDPTTIGVLRHLIDLD